MLKVADCELAGSVDVVVISVSSRVCVDCALLSRAKRKKMAKRRNPGMSSLLHSRVPHQRCVEYFFNLRCDRKSVLMKMNSRCN